MNWDSLQDFVRMGGYGIYVWGAYVVALLAMAGETWLTARAQRRAALPEEAGGASGAEDDEEDGR